LSIEVRSIGLQDLKPCPGCSEPRSDRPTQVSGETGCLLAGGSSWVSSRPKPSLHGVASDVRSALLSSQSPVGAAVHAPQSARRADRFSRTPRPARTALCRRDTAPATALDDHLPSDTGSISIAALLRVRTLDPQGHPRTTSIIEVGRSKQQEARQMGGPAGRALATTACVCAKLPVRRGRVREGRGCRVQVLLLLDH